MKSVAQQIYDFAHGRQYHRFLSMEYPRNDPPPAMLLVNQLEAFEGLSRDFEFKLELLSDDANLALKDMQGKLLCVKLVRKDGSLRYFTGYVFEFRLRRVDGGFVFYEAVLGPWLKLLSLHKDNYLFHSLTLCQQLELIFRDYPTYPNWEFRVRGEDAVMRDGCQFDESDFNYVSRNLEAAGWCYWYEHSDNGHKLIISDNTSLSAPIDGDVEVPFQRHAGSEEEDGIADWSPVRKIVPGSTALTIFDYKTMAPVSWGCKIVPTINRQGAVPAIETYEYAGPEGARSTNDSDKLARLRMEEMEAAGKHFDAAGNNRQLLPGRWFRLTGHYSDVTFDLRANAEKHEFLILDVHHTVRNNYLQHQDQRPHYSNRLTCIRKTIPWRPGRSFNSVDTKILAPQTGIVVGHPAMEGIYTNEYGCVHVQLHWDRVGKRNFGGSVPIRVSSAWAGNTLGMMAIPRVGSEVVVVWLSGSPNHPLIIGSVYDARNMPPWALPLQRALTGVRSRELAPNGGNAAGGRSNHLILDDTDQKIQAQLKSDHQYSQLSLGYITRIDGTAGRLDGRGIGWELVTNAWGVARAGQGMLVTTQMRQNAAGPSKDLDETAGRLDSAANLQGMLADIALEAGALETPDQQAAVAEALKHQNDAIRGKGGDAEFPELAEPHLVLASPAGIETTAAQSTHIASGEHTAITSGKNLSIASGAGLFASVGKALRVLVHKAGMKLIAVSGKIQIQSQDDDVEIIARKVLYLFSQMDWVDIRGKQGVRIHGGQTLVEVCDQMRVNSAMPALFHGGLETLPPKSVSQAFNEMPHSRFDQEVRLMQVDNKPAPNIAVDLLREDGDILDGKSGASGSTQLQKSTGIDEYTIRYKGELP